MTYLASAYERARPRLVRVAYAILGSHADAEDVVADCWSRLHAANERDPVRDVVGWGTVAVARASLDVLRSARARREVYVGPWLPEPVVTALGPADHVSLDESVRFALLVILERLTPPERTAWVLHDVFGVPFAEIAVAVGRKPAAVRQLAARARHHVVAAAPRIDVDPAEHDRVVTAFVTAAAAGDLSGLVGTLDPSVVLTSDGGGVVSAARRPVHGRGRVARFVLGGLAKHPVEVVPVRVNGSLGLAYRLDGALGGVVSLTVVNGSIARVDIVLNPAKLPRARSG